MATKNTSILSVGDTFHYDGYKHHVVAIFRDTDEGGHEGTLYVLKHFGKHKRWWHYEVMSEWAYQLKAECNLIKP